MSLFLELDPIFKIGTLLAELQVILAADGGGYLADLFVNFTRIDLKNNSLLYFFSSSL